MKSPRTSVSLSDTATAPRLGTSSTSPSAASILMASRSGVSGCSTSGGATMTFFTAYNSPIWVYGQIETMEGNNQRITMWGLSQ